LRAQGVLETNYSNHYILQSQCTTIENLKDKKKQAEILSTTKNIEA